MRHILRVLVGMALLLGLAVPRPAWAVRSDWEFGDNRYFVVERICRDGVAFSAIDSNAGLVVLGQASFQPAFFINLGARLYTNAGTPLPVPGNAGSRQPAAAYGPALSSLITYTLPVQTAPLAADINNNAVFEAGEYYDVYLYSEYLFFGQPAAPGQTVVVTHNSFNDAGQELGYTSGVVADCRLAAFTAAVGQVTTAPSGVVSAGALPAASVNYWLYGLPASGALRKNGVALTAGQSFTQADLNNGEISYAHAGATAGFDRVRYGAAGTARVSLSSAGQAGDGASSEPALSADGRYVAFVSAAANLVAGDTNTCLVFGGGPNPQPCPDVFVRDLLTGTTTRVSVGPAGAQSNGQSQQPAISADGRYVAFVSAATNLVTGDTNTCAGDGYAAAGTCPDVFVYDRQTGATTRVSVGPGNAQADHPADDPALSADGRYVAFVSAASTLVASDTNNVADVFVRDRQAGTTGRVSVSTAGVQQNDGGFNVALAGSGRYVVFDSFADNLLGTGGDGNSGSDIFLRDRDTDNDGIMDEAGAVSTTRVSLRDGGTLEDNGASGGSFFPAVSADGRYVAFKSYSTDLVSNDFNGVADIFLRDRQANRTWRVSVNAIGQEVNTFSFDSPGLSADGRFVAFQESTNAVIAGDSNSAPDIVVYDRDTGAVRLASANSAGVIGNNGSAGPALSADGRFVAFSSYADNLVAGDTANPDIYVRLLDRYDTLGLAVLFPVFAPQIRR
ncbi:MAG: PD40 domain-containing protein [Anaerolineales bacterium]|nr:PD40 domain-containing protein [Anaerolineales bacterium]